MRDMQEELEFYSENPDEVDGDGWFKQFYGSMENPPRFKPGMNPAGSVSAPRKRRDTKPKRDQAKRKKKRKAARKARRKTRRRRN